MHLVQTSDGRFFNLEQMTDAHFETVDRQPRLTLFLGDKLHQIAGDDALVLCSYLQTLTPKDGSSYYHDLTPLGELIDALDDLLVIHDEAHSAAALEEAINFLRLPLARLKRTVAQPNQPPASTDAITNAPPVGKSKRS